MDEGDDIKEYFKLSFYDNCRICLGLNENSTSIQSLKQSNDINSLLTYFSIEVMDDDRYPNGICATCIDQLNNIIAFKQMCGSTFNYLTNVLQDSYSEQNINENHEVQENDFIIQYIDSESELNNDIVFNDKSNIEMIEITETINDDGIESSSLTSTKNKYEMKPYACSMCWKRFTRRCKLREHEQKFHGEIPHPSAKLIKPFVCSICSAAFTRRFTLNINKRKHHGEQSIKTTMQAKTLKPFICTVCLTSFTQKNALKEHKKKFHEVREINHYSPYGVAQRDLKPYACTDCSMKFSREYILNRHKQKYHNYDCKESIFTIDGNVEQKPFVCHICFTSFSRGDTLNEHKRKYHRDFFPSDDNSSSRENNKVTCNVCARSFSREIMLVKHMEKYHSEKRQLISDIENDENSTTISELKKAFFCGACSKTFAQKQTLKEHIEKCHEMNPPHSPSDPISCTNVDDTVTIKTEESPFQFECRYCEQSFECKNTLLTHMSNVHESREYNFDLLCALCGEVFCSKYDLTNHNKLFHSDSRNYLCNYCHRRFKNFENFQKHERTIHLMPHVNVTQTATGTEKLFYCDQCSRIFSQKPTLDVHKKLVHSQLPKVS